MKYLIVIIFLWAGPLKADSTQTRYFRYLQDSAHSGLCFGCGWAGQDSYDLILFSSLIRDKEYGYIQELLSSTSAHVQYMAAISCIYLEKKKILRLDSVHTRKLNELRNSHVQISYRSGCSGYGSVSLTYLLQKKNLNSGINAYFIREIRNSL